MIDTEAPERRSRPSPLPADLLNRETGKPARRQANAAPGRLEHVIPRHLRDVGTPIELLLLVFDENWCW